MQDLSALRKKNSEEGTVILCSLLEDTYSYYEDDGLGRIARKILTYSHNEEDCLGRDSMVDKDIHGNYEGMVLIMKL